MTGDVVTNVLLGLVAVGVPVTTFLHASRADRTKAHAEEVKAEIEKEGVDARAYERAAELYEGIVGSLRTEVDRLAASNAQLADEVARLRDTNVNLVIEIGTLREANAVLNREVSFLRAEVASLRK